MQMVGKWYQDHELDIITDNIVLALSTEETRINVLIVTDSLKKPHLLVIQSLTDHYNIHVLENSSGNYELHSFFKNADLKTALYRKTVTIRKHPSDNKEYINMLTEIKSIYGISVETNVIDKKQIIAKIQSNGKKHKINYPRAQEKLIEYTFIQDILLREKIKQSENTINTPPAEPKAPQVEQKTTADNHPPKKKLTIPQRIYLKIRYKLFGWWYNSLYTSLKLPKNAIIIIWK